MAVASLRAAGTLTGALTPTLSTAVSAPAAGTAGASEPQLPAAAPTVAEAASAVAVMMQQLPAALDGKVRALLLHHDAC